MLCTRVAWVCLVCLLLCREEGSSPASLIWACMRCPCLCLFGFWDRDYVSQLPCVRYYVFVKSSFKHAREGLCVLGALYLIFQDLVNCYLYFVL